MARKKKDAIAKYDERFAAYAQKAAQREAKVAGGEFISHSKGQLKFGDAPVAGNKLAAIILASTHENAYFASDYDPTKPQSPACYAFSLDGEEMKPHEAVSNPCSDSCAECHYNEWGTAERGKGKACKNRRRLALLSAGEFDRNDNFKLIDDLEHFKTSEVAYLALPVTSVKGYASYVKNLNTHHSRPPFGVITMIEPVPHERDQYHLQFELIEMLPNNLFDVIEARHKEAEKGIIFPYPEFEDQEKSKKKTKKSSDKRQTKRGKGRTKF